MLALSYIVFLHQTTTADERLNNEGALSYIIFLHQTTTAMARSSWLALLSYIVFLHQTTTSIHFIPSMRYCLISSFYIKPQLCQRCHNAYDIVLYRLSTSNHNPNKAIEEAKKIVLYRLSTSNHNISLQWLTPFIIVLYRLSTSNHNQPGTH